MQLSLLVGQSSLFHVMEDGCHLWVVGVGTPHCWWVDGRQLSSFVPILCCCSWVRGMGAPRFSCAVMPVSCHGGRSSLVGGWSGCSSSLVGFCGLWVVVCASLWLFVGSQGFVLMVGGSCCSWAVVPILCGGWLWFMGYCGGHPMLLVAQLWLFMGSHTHFVLWWAVVMGGCAPRHSWILTGGSCGHSWAVVPVSCCGGWLVQFFVGFETMCDSSTLTSKPREPMSWVWVRLGLQIPNPHPHPPPPMTPTHDIPYRPLAFSG